MAYKNVTKTIKIPIQKYYFTFIWVSNSRSLNRKPLKMQPK